MKDLLADHVVLGQKLRLDEVAGAFHFKTSGGRIAGVQLNEGEFYSLRLGDIDEKKGVKDRVCFR